MRTVILDNRAIAALAARPAVTGEFPFLLRRTAGDCCGRKPQPAYAEIRATLATMPGDRVRRLKEILVADVIVVHTAEGRGVRL